MRLSSSVAEPVTEVKQVVVFIAPPEAVSVLRAVLDKLPSNFPAAVIFLVHTGTGLERPLAENLNMSPRLLVAPGVDGTSLRNGRGYVVPQGLGIVIDKAGVLTLTPGAEPEALLALQSQPLIARDSPQADVLLASLGAYFGKGAVAVALTAISAQEAEGFRLVRRAGGHTIALDEAKRLWADSSGPRVVPGAEDECLSDSEIGPRLAMLFTSPYAKA